MNDRRFIKPASGRIVRDPATGNMQLPAHGRGVAWDSFWQRRFDQGDVEPTTEEAVLAAESAAPQAAAPSDAESIESDQAEQSGKPGKSKGAVDKQGDRN